MHTTAVTSSLSMRSASDRDDEWSPLAARLMSTTAELAPAIAAKVVLVGFPVLLPGDDGRVIPFGRYDLAALYQSASPSAASQQAVLVNQDSGARIVLFVQQLNAIAQDPDVEIL